jgi:hypothetical protein
MAADEPFKINITVPFGYHKPFDEVVQQVTSMGLNVSAAHAESQAIQGSGSPEILQNLKAIPGIYVSHDDHQVTWKV